MDYQKFIEQVSDLYDNWGQDSVSVKSEKFQEVLKKVNGMTTANVMQLLNFAIECMEPGEIYCEVGCFQGSTLVGALLDHPEQMAYAVDNFSEFDKEGENYRKLMSHLEVFGLEEQVCFANKDFEEFFSELRGMEIEDKIGVYFYDGAHDYRSQMIGLMLAKPFLANRALIIVDDSNWSAVQQANSDFIAAHPECHLLLDLPTPKNGHHTFWNGIQVFGWDKNARYDCDWEALQQHRTPELIQAIYHLPANYLNENKLIEQIHTEGLALFHNKQYAEAEKKFRQVLNKNKNHAPAWLNLGTLYYTTERYADALEALAKCLEIDSKDAIKHYTVGLVLEKVGAIPQAIQAHKQAIALDSNWIDAYNSLGNIFCETGDLEEAESVYRQAIAAKAEHFGSYLNLGNVLLEQERVDEAIAAYEQALQLKPRDPDILYNLGVAFEAKDNHTEASLNYGYAFYRQGKYQEAIEQYQQFLEYKTGDVFLYDALAECYKSLNQCEKAIQTYEEGLKIYPRSGFLYFQLILVLQFFGQTKEAITVAQKASQLLPDILALKLEEKRLLPIIYENEEEIEFYRQRFVKSLEELIHQSSLDTPEAKKSALQGVGTRTNFFLQYQGKNDIKLQKQYGQFVHQVMAANYPEWLKPLSIAPRSQNRKIRIGYVSDCMRTHTVGKEMLGWLKNANHQDFEVYCYSINRVVDVLTQQYRLYSNYFHHIPENIEGICKQILADQLDVLVFFEIGMHPQLTQMAALRLAPVQCTTWGHPITTGLSTVDYFLSSQLMEPENAQEHYSEQLIALPNIGISYTKPVIPEPKKSREEFGLRDEAVLYLSCQSLFKYLPQYDYIFPAIAQKVPQAQFAFISHGSAHITDIFRKRLELVFAGVGLSSEEHCVILPRIGWNNYCNLNCISDIFLDTLSWSGGNTALEAIACNLPIVTCPGEFMRGRHSYGILTMLGVTDTIAQTETEYIDIAVKLGLDQEWRNSVVKRMSQRHSFLYDDITCVEALEAFYRRVVSESV